MQIYTKIFIGMAAGIVFGLLLGPQSGLLGHDVIIVGDPNGLKLLATPGGGPAPVTLPKLKGSRDVALRLKVEGAETAGGRGYFRVSFKVSNRLALADGSGRLKQGQRLFAWVDKNAVSRPVSSLGQTIIDWVAPLGEAFLRLIMMIVVPLVFASLLVGVASLGNPRHLGRLGGKTLGYFMITTTLAISIGLAVVNVFQPGKYISADDKEQLVAEYAATASSKTSRAAERPSAMRNLLSMIPKNPVKSLAAGEMLQIIFFAAIFGFALTLLDRERARPVIALFEAVNDAMVKVVELVMKLAPIGVFALVAQVVGQSGLGVLKALLAYALVVIAGLFLHVLLVYTPVVALLARVSPLDFLRAARPAQLIAFSTSSSSATLPVTMDCAEKRLCVSNKIASFVLPLGSTVNMDGTALYQGVAAVFIAQVFDIHLTFVDQLSIVLTATLASIGAAGVPGVGMVTLAMVLTAIQVPTVGVALILGVDRILDMFRTAVNVTGDLSATVLVASSEGETIGYRGQAT